VASPGPSPWLRLTAVAVAAVTVLSVVSGATGMGTAHRLLAALALPPLGAVTLAAWSAHRQLLRPSLAAGSLFAAAAFARSPELHLALAAAALAASTVLAALAYRGQRQPFGSWRDYLALTKPRVMSLLLLTGFCGLVAGAQGLPSPTVTVVSMVGLALACGGAAALNHVLDRDIDRLMGKRTRLRPVAAGRIAPSHALEFGLALSALSFTVLAGTVNVLAATLALVGNLFYVVVYTRWLKRATAQNIVIGGAAGAVPPLVGWAAATGNLALPALFLFLIVFLWTPPHFWALALLLKRDYAAAGVPMLPVVRGERATARQILLYSAFLVAFSAVPFLAGSFGSIYLGVALTLGAWLLWLAARLNARPTAARASALFHYSLLYLALLFVAAAVDPLVL